MQNTQEKVTTLLDEYVKQAFENYGLVIALLVIGFVLGWLFKTFVMDWKYNQQIKIRFKEKDQRIAELNFIISNRLNKIEVEKLDKAFFNRVKKYFKKFAIKK